MSDENKNLTQPLLKSKSVSIVQPGKTTLDDDSPTPTERVPRKKMDSEKSTKYKDIIREDLSIEQIDELFESFTLFDKDYDGAINKTELSTIMKSIGLNATESEIQDMLAEADTVFFKDYIL